MKAPRKFTVTWTLLVFAILLVGRDHVAGGPGDGLLDNDAPELGTQAPAPTNLQLGNWGLSEQTGAVTYGFTIEVPPGRRGMGSKLSLGLVGALSAYHLADGWSHHFLHAHHRCHRRLSGRFHECLRTDRRRS